MVLRSLELTDFRNFESRKLVFSSRNIFFTGANGSGKSNLLESIAFASLLRSFRGASPREMIRIGGREFRLQVMLESRIGNHRLQISEEISGRRRLFINGDAIRKSSDFIREFHTVVFAPEDREIVSGTSGCRRRFFDIMISGVDGEYLQRLSRYHRALIQRNRALKNAPHTASAFEEELAEQAPFIAAKRRHFAAVTGEKVAALLGEKGSFQIVYRTDSGADSKEHRRIFEAKKESELRRQCTLCGPQLDEFEFFYNGKLLRTYGSTGQRRLIALLLKLAEFDILQSNSRAPVVVLADDVTGELDESNLKLFLNNIAQADQCFFTFAEPPGFSLPDSEYIAVAGGD